MSIYLNTNDADEDQEFTDDEIDAVLLDVKAAIESGSSYVCLEYYKDEE